MSPNDLKERLQILLEQHVIDRKEYDIAIAAFDRLLMAVNKNELQQAEMLFTHLPMALSRIENGEKVEEPDRAIISEVQNSAVFPLAKKQVSSIEKKWGGELPKGEKEFLYMHYVNIINLNGGE